MTGSDVVEPSSARSGGASRPGFFDRSGQQIDLPRYIELHGDLGYRIVARDQVGERQVVTAWLGVDHGPIADSDGPLIFGTVALEPDGQLWQERELLAATEHEALGHHQTVRQELVDQCG